ncbi:MAG: hypothetical protein K5930_09400 [Treponemataceae bacterium]|nr:hypothetical protein [Treponemataceae bacterium]
MKVLDEVIHQYLEAHITLKETADKTIEAVFLNPSYFRIDKMTEDDRSDFIIYIYPKIQGIIKTYNPKISSFGTYLTSFVSSMLRSWLKMNYKKQAQVKAIEDYAFSEFAINVADSEPEYEVEKSRSLKLDSEIPATLKRYLRSGLKRIPDSTKIMLLALKSEYFLNSSHIEKLQRMTGIPEEKILDMFLLLQVHLYKKKRTYDHHKELQNKSYIMKKRSNLLLDSAEENSCFFEQLKKTKEYHDSLWKKHTESLKKLKICIPSNTEITKILDITTDQIRRLQKHIKDIVESM